MSAIKDARALYADYLEREAGAVNTAIALAVRRGEKDDQHGVRIALFAIEREREQQSIAKARGEA